MKRIFIMLIVAMFSFAVDAQNLSSKAYPADTRMQKLK